MKNTLPLWMQAEKDRYARRQAYIRRQLRAHLPFSDRREWEEREVEYGRALTRDEIRASYGWWGAKGHTYPDGRRCKCASKR